MLTPIAHIRLLLVFFFLFLFFKGTATYYFSPVPQWVKPFQFDQNENIAKSDVNDGYYYSLSDVQVHIARRENYFHYAYKVVSEVGVQNASEIVISYDPSYEKLFLHSLKVYRNGKVIDKKKDAKIRELQRESNLEQHIYDESLSAIILLKDIRPGDVIEYDYSINGENPVFNGKFYRKIYFHYSYELLNFHYRLIKPLQCHLKTFHHLDSLSYEIVRNDKEEEWVWKIHHLPKIVGESNSPDWFEPYPFVELCEYKDWKEVRSWAQKLFGNQDVLSDSLQSLINKIDKESKSPEEKVINSLRFVQDQIRYFGIEIGANSHQPHSPNKTFQQRFGDCKDKAFLFCKILSKMGIKAYVALVNTNGNQYLKDVLPSLNVFNHAIVKVELAGKLHWFDPTISYQRGDINHYYTPDFGYAFVIDNSSGGLEKMQTPLLAETILKENYRLKSINGETVITVETSYLGKDADNIRHVFASSKMDDIQQQYFDFYQKSFPEITDKKDIEVEDLENENKFIVKEEYYLNSLWNNIDSTSPNVFKASFQAHLIKDKLNSFCNTKVQERSSPTVLEYPCKLTHEINIQVPIEWEINTENYAYEDSLFSFHFITSYENRTISLSYDYTAISPFINSEALGTCTKSANHILDNWLNYELSYDSSVLPIKQSKLTNWLLVLVAIMFGFICYVQFNRLYHKTDQIAPDMSNVTRKKIGGWLLLPAIGLFIGLFVRYNAIYSGNYYDLEEWNLHTNPTLNTYCFLWGPLNVFKLLGQLLLLMMSIFLIILLTTYDRRFPHFMILYYVMQIVFVSISLGLALGVKDDNTFPYKLEIKSLMFYSIAAIIWIPYFRLSERCKKTFVK